MQTTRSRPTQTSAPEPFALWREYRLTGDSAVRDRIVFTFTPMVCYAVESKLAAIPAERDVEDFLSRAFEALISAIERFEPDDEVTLEQFAWTQVYAALLEELGRGGR